MPSTVSTYSSEFAGAEAEEFPEGLLASLQPTKSPAPSASSTGAVCNNLYMDHLQKDNERKAAVKSDLEPCRHQNRL
jgi:hypothetical protein